MFAGPQHPPEQPDFASRMIGNVSPLPARPPAAEAAMCGFVLVCPPC
jgi:hypothetical protein